MRGLLISRRVPSAFSPWPQHEVPSPASAGRATRPQGGCGTETCALTNQWRANSPRRLGNAKPRTARPSRCILPALQAAAGACWRPGRGRGASSGHNVISPTAPPSWVALTCHPSTVRAPPASGSGSAVRVPVGTRQSHHSQHSSWKSWEPIKTRAAHLSGPRCPRTQVKG